VGDGAVGGTAPRSRFTCLAGVKDALDEETLLRGERMSRPDLEGEYEKYRSESLREPSPTSIRRYWITVSTEISMRSRRTSRPLEGKSPSDSGTT